MSAKIVTAKKTGKALRSLLATSVLASVAVGGMNKPAFAVGDNETPMGEQVVGGSASFDRPDASTLNVTQSTDRAVINWDSFNIGAKATTEFFQPSSHALAVNRVVGKGEDPAQILGTLKANGRLMILDRNGVLFGAHATINVGSIVASTGDVDNDAVMRGDEKLILSNFGNGAIVNEGAINAADAGLVAFVAPTVTNAGVINAKLGKVALASGGESATVDLYGDGLVELALNDQKSKALIKNSGAINAEGGTVLMTAAAAKEAVDDVINTSGIVRVSSVEQVGGKIILKGGKTGTVNISGTLDASGKTGGGTVGITGQNIAVSDAAAINVDAIDNGHGGTVSIIADDFAALQGAISARGGVNGGDGGTAELSAGDSVAFAGLVDTSADLGTTGSFLIDPKNLEIGNYNSAVTAAQIIADAIAGGTINDMTVDSKALANTLRSTNVNLWATNSISTTADVDISTWHGSKSSTGITANDLTLSAATVNLDNNVTLGTGHLYIYDMAKGQSALGLGLLPTPADIHVGTVNVTGTVFTRNTVGGATSIAGSSQLDGVADTVNVKSTNAQINQGISFADANGATVNVVKGTFDQDVVLDKANITLNGAKAGTGSSDPSRGTDETIITPHSPGIVVTGDNSIVSGFVVDGGSDGILVQNADNVKVLDNIIKHTTDNGIHVTGSKNAQVTANTVTDTDAAANGINFENSDGTISFNIINKTGDGILLYNATDASAITGNAIGSTDLAGLISAGAGNIYGDGIRINAADNATIKGNTIQQAITALTGVGNGMWIINSDNVTVGGLGVGEGNTVKNVSWDGIKVDHTDNAKIIGNSTDQTTRTGIYAYLTTNSLIANNVVKNSLLTELGGIGVKGGSDFTIDSNKISAGANDGINIRDVKGSKNVVSNNGIDGVAHDGIYATNTTGLTITGNNIGQHAAGPGTIGDTGVYADNDAGVKIDHNHVNTGITGYDIRNSNGAFIGHNVAEFQSGNGFNVKNSSGVKIQFNRADKLDGVGFNVVGDLNALVWGNRAYLIGGDAFDVLSSNGVVITGNFVGSDLDGVSKGDGNVHGDGFRIVGSNGAVITGNTIQQTISATTGHGNGMWISNSNDITVGGSGVGEGNTVKNVSWDGIKIDHVDNALVIGNTTDQTVRTGIYSNLSTNSTISNNTITNSQIVSLGGIGVKGGSNMTVTGNTVNDDAGSGIHMLNTTGTNTISGNFIGTLSGFHNIKGDGIHAEGVSGLTVSSNTISNVAGNGIFIDPITGPVVSYNTISNIGIDGIALFDTDNAQVLYNTLTSITRDGIHVEGGEGDLIKGNTITGINGGIIFLLTEESEEETGDNGIDGAGRDGIHVENHDNVIISHNTIQGADGSFLSSAGNGAGHDGIYVSDSDNANIRKNKILGGDGGFLAGGAYGAGHDGIEVIGGENATIKHNKILQGSGSDGETFLEGFGGLGAGNNGITVNGNAFALVKDNRVDGVGNDGIFAGYIHNDGEGDEEQVKIEAETETPDVTITGNKVDNTGAHGIEVYDVTTSMIDHNKVGTKGGPNNIGENGIVVSSEYYDDPTTIISNIVKDTGWNGIAVYGVDTAIINDNKVSNTGDDGIYVYDTATSSIDGNTIFNTGWNGIEVDEGGSTSITNNVVAMAGWDGIQVYDVGYYGFDGIPVTITGNQVILTQRHGIATFYTGSVDIEDNEVALAGTNFANWSFDTNEEPEGGDEQPTERIQALIDELPSDGTITLNWGNGDGIHVEDAYNTFFSTPAFAKTEEVEAPVNTNAVLISGNNVKYTGGDGIEVRYSGSTEISDNTVGQTGINSTTFDAVSFEGSFVDAVKSVLFGKHLTPNFDSGEMISFVDSLVPPSLTIGYGTGDGIHVEDTGAFNGNFFTSFDDLSDDDYSVKITGNTIDTTGGDGIDAYYDDWSLITGNKVSNAGQSTLNGYTDAGFTFYGDDYEDFHGFGDGILVDNGTTGEGEYDDDFSVTKVAGNTVTDSADNNIEVLDVNRSLIDGNTVSFSDEFEGGNNNIVVAVKKPDVKEEGFKTLFALNDGETGDYETIVSNNLTVDNAPQNGVVIDGLDQALIASNVITNSGSNGLFVQGPDNGSVVLTGNTFTNNPVGAFFESGAIDLTGETNTFNGGDVGMLFAPFDLDGEGDFADMNLVGDTIGTTTFNGQSTFYVQLANGAFFDPGTPTLLSALDATFDGFTPNSVGGILTQAQYDALEAKIFHFNDDPTLGLFFFGTVADEETQQDINEEDLFRFFSGLEFPGNGFNLTITGLPNVPGANPPPPTLNVADIAPAAGGDTQPQNIEPAAGGPAGAQTTCWGDIAPNLGTGQPVQYSYGNSLNQTLSDISTCNSGQF